MAARRFGALSQAVGLLRWLPELLPPAAGSGNFSFCGGALAGAVLKRLGVRHVGQEKQGEILRVRGPVPEEFAQLTAHSPQV